VSVRLHTQDRLHQLTQLPARVRVVREILLERLTETQYRRLALLFGFDGPAMGVRETARAEGVRDYAIRQSRDSAFLRLKNDWRLWLFWLLQHMHTPNSQYSRESDAATLQEVVDGVVELTDVIDSDDVEAYLLMEHEPGTDGGSYGSDPQAGQTVGYDLAVATSMKREKHVPGKPEERDQYAAGWVAFHECRSTRMPRRLLDRVRGMDAPLRHAWRSGWYDARKAGKRVS
jgi:hypothetical protein